MSKKIKAIPEMSVELEALPTPPTTKMKNKPFQGFPFSYYRFGILLQTEMLATMPDTSISYEHIMVKHQKLIEQYNRLKNKRSKEAVRFMGPLLEDEKVLLEIHGILRSYMEILKAQYALPTTMDEALALSEELEALIQIQNPEQARATRFYRMSDGRPAISSHMLLGNFKENLRISTNNGQPVMSDTKVGVTELGILGLKVVEPFLLATQDVVRNTDGTAFIYERPIIFDRKGVRESAIGRSEILPAGTEFHGHLRVLKGSPADNLDSLHTLFTYGRSNGLGQWHGSGGKGQFVYKLEIAPDYREVLPSGWM
jgi:hypothetical protein